jgi:hypothetical protein
VIGTIAINIAMLGTIAMLPEQTINNGRPPPYK